MKIHWQTAAESYEAFLRIKGRNVVLQVFMGEGVEYQNDEFGVIYWFLSINGARVAGGESETIEDGKNNALEVLKNLEMGK